MTDSGSPPESRIAGLTMYLAGPSLDAKAMMTALSLRPIRSEDAATNQVTIFNRSRPPITAPVTRRVETNRLKVTVQGEDRSIDGLFRKLIAAVDGLPPGMKLAWEKLTGRTADLGVYWTNESNCGTEFDIPTEIIASLAAARIGLRISVYATQQAIDRAISDRTRTDEPSSPGGDLAKH